MKWLPLRTALVLAGSLTALMLAGSAMAQSTFTVNSTAADPDVDIGDGTCATAAATCTLLAAVQEANTTTDRDSIVFAIPQSDPGYDAGTGIFSIRPTSSLIAFQPLAIDGSTQDEFDGLPVIEISGAAAVGTGLDIRGATSVVHAVSVVSWSGAGIQIDADSVTITGSLLGTNRMNASGIGNAWGINAGGSTGSVVGGATAAARNVISGNSTGVSVSSWVDSQILGNRIGTTIDGLTALGNATDGLSFTNANGLTVGGNGGAPNTECSGACNLISGNGWNGIYAGSAAAGTVLVRGNYIGVDASGTVAMTNGRDGISVPGSGGLITIGGTGASDRNVISGNTQNGIRVFNSGRVQVMGNYVGTSDDGGAAIPNLLDGINVSTAANVIGGLSSGAGNFISGNVGAGIRQDGGVGNSYYGNRVGLASDGVTAIGNGQWGFLIGSSSSATNIGSEAVPGRNVVSGNAAGGMRISGNDQIIRGNYVGLDTTGTIAVPNAGSGIRVLTGQRVVVGGSEPGQGNTLSGNQDHGLELGGLNGTVAGNTIGLDALGAARPNGINGILVDGDANTIGGTAPGEANIISGNTEHGVALAYPLTTNFAENNLVQGNYIGFGADLNSTIGNGGSGVFVGFQAPDNTVDQNIIGGNQDYGVRVGSTARRTIVTRNVIGATADLTVAVPNASGGVLTDTDAGTYGGISGEGNTIVYNGGAGVTVVTGTIAGLASGFNNTIRGNSIFGNETIGIDLGASPDGVTLNDVQDLDSNFGGNRQQNYPIITSSSGAPLQLGGYLNSVPSTTYEVDFYANETCDATGWGEGQQYLGTIELTTDAEGNAEFDAMLGMIDLVGNGITATATHPFDGTSEFGPCVQIGSVDLAVAKSVTPDPALVNTLLSYSIAVWNEGPGGATDIVVTDTLPSQFTLDGVIAGADECEVAGNILNCLFDTLPAADTVQIGFSGFFDTTGVVTNVVDVAAAQVDNNRNNNAAASVVQVLQSASDMAITAFSPGELVGEMADTLTITGQGFIAGATVSLEPTDQLGDDNTGPLDAEVLTVTSTEVVAAVSIPDELWVGDYDVVVSNPGGTSTRRPILIVPHLAYPALRGTGALAFPIGVEKSNYLQIVNIGANDGIVWVEIYPPDPDAIDLRIFDPSGQVLWDGQTAADPSIVELMLDMDVGETITLRTSWRVDPSKVIFPETVSAAKFAGTADVGFNSSQTVSWEGTRGAGKAQMVNILKSVLLGGVCRSIGQKFAGLDVSVLDAAVESGLNVLKERGAMRPEDIMQEIGEALGEKLIPGYGQVQFAAEIGACVGEILKGISDTIKIKAKSSADRLRRRHGSSKRAKDALLDKVLEGGASARFRLQAALEIERQMDQNPCNPHLADRNKYKGWVRGPWDPNDKVTNADFICEYGLVDGEVRCVRYYVPLAAAETPITYTILFENKAEATGDATIVTVTDELPAELDPATLEVVSSSHADKLSVDVTDQTATFTFDDIGLPPNVTPPEGEGYVEFTVTPRVGLFSGTEIRNDASIVFDFNPAITTPEVVHEIRAIADLQATATVDVDSLLTDSVVTVNYTVVNAGPDNASNVVLTVHGGDGTTILSATSSTAACSLTLPEATCDVGDLWVGAASDFTVRASRSTIGFLELDASFALGETEGDPGNSTFSTSVNVYGSVGVERAGGEVPRSTRLLPSYPNPASDVATIAFDVATQSAVEIAIYDVVGRRVAVVVDKTVQAGRYTIPYSAARLASGVYFVNAQIGEYRGAKKMVVLR